jgi:hypothetical protein
MHPRLRGDLKRLVFAVAAGCFAFAAFLPQREVAFALSRLAPALLAAGLIL